MALIRLIEGPVGVGKSTFASQVCKDNKAPRLILDNWMAPLFRPDRPSANIIE